MKLALFSMMIVCIASPLALAQTDAPAAVGTQIVIADEATPQPEIPVFNEAELVTEVNISDKDVLDYLRLGALAFGASAKGAKGEIGEFVQAVDLESLAAAISDLKYVRMLQFRLAQPEEPRRILDFYTSAAGAGWNRILWDISTPGRGVMMLAKPGLGEVMAVAVMPEKPAKPEFEEEGVTGKDQEEESEPSSQRLVVGRTVGMVNLQKLGAWAGKVLVKFSEWDARRKAPAKAPAKPAVKKAPVKPAAKPVKK